MRWLKTSLPACAMQCVYCGGSGRFRHVKSYEHEDEILSLYECPNCKSLAYDLKGISAPIVPRQDAISPEGWEATRYLIEVGISAHYVAMCALAALPDTTEQSLRSHAFVDIGAGFGLASYFVKTVFGMSTVTVEPSCMGKVSNEILGLDVHREYFEDLPEEVLGQLSKKSCYLHLNSVVEHLVDPFRALRDMMGRARVDVLAATVPDKSALDFDGSFLNALQFLAPRDHRHLPSKRGMEILMKRLGFAHVHVDTTNGLLTAVGSTSPITFPTERTIRLSEQLLLENLMRHPNPLLAGGGASRSLRFAVVNRNAPLIADLRARFPYELDSESLLQRIAERQWDDLPFHLGSTCYWLAFDAFSEGRSEGARALLKVACAFADRMAEDFPHFAMNALDYKWAALLLDSHILFVGGDYNAAEAPLNVVLDSKADPKTGARASHFDKARADLRTIRARAASESETARRASEAAVSDLAFAQ